MVVPQLGTGSIHTLEANPFAAACEQPGAIVNNLFGHGGWVSPPLSDPTG